MTRPGCFVAIFKRIPDRKFSNFFRCRKNFHPKSCEIARKSARPDNARPPCYSNGSSHFVGRALARRGLRVLPHFPSRFGPRIFEFFFGAAKSFIRNRARSRQNQPGRTTPDLRGTPTGPHKVGRALARRGLRVLSHFQSRFGPKNFEILSAPQKRRVATKAETKNFTAPPCCAYFGQNRVASKQEKA